MTTQDGNITAKSNDPVVERGAFHGPRARLRPILEKISARLPDSVDIMSMPLDGKTYLLRYLAAPQGALSDCREWLQPPYQQEPWRLFMLLVEFHYLHPSVHPLIYLYQKFSAACTALLDALNPAAPAAPAQHFDAALIAHLRRMPPALLNELHANIGAAQPLAQPPVPPLTPSQAAEAIWRTIGQLSRLGLRPVLLLDDIDTALDIHRQPGAVMTYDDTSAMRPWRDAAAFVLTHERPIGEVNPEASASTFFQSITHVSLAPQDKAEATEVVSGQMGSVTLPDEDLNYVIEQAGLNRHLLTLAGIALSAMRLHLPPDRPLTLEQRDILAFRLMDDFGRAFRVYLHHLSADERETLRALAHDRALTDRQRRLLNPLADKGMLVYDAERTQYKLFSPLFVDYLKGDDGENVTGGDTSGTSSTSSEAATPEAAAVPPGLSDLEERLHRYLFEHRGQECTFDELWQHVWSGERGVEGPEQHRRIQVAVSRLRRKLKERASGQDVVSVRSGGYKLL
jgi:hypothetical protein